MSRFIFEAAEIAQALIGRIGWRQLREDIKGLNAHKQGRLRLSQYDPDDLLPLAGLGDDVISYIQSQGGGGALADAVNYYGTNPTTITTGATTAVVTTPSITDWKLCGFVIYGDGDATIKITFTPSGGSATELRWKIHNLERNGSVSFRNAIVISNGTVVTLSITNNTTGSVDYYSVLCGEAVVA